jgi:hypothetical protein
LRTAALQVLFPARGREIRVYIDETRRHHRGEGDAKLGFARGFGRNRFGKFHCGTRAILLSAASPPEEDYGPPPGYYQRPPPGYYDRPCPPGFTVQGGACKPYRGPAGGNWRTWNGCPPGYTVQGGECRAYHGY